MKKRPTVRALSAKVLVGNECWHWRGVTTDNGYGLYSGRRAHRLMYEALVGPIPEGLDLDHLCHNADLRCEGGVTCPHRRCVRPSHLAPATRSDNLRRASARITHCPQGHAYEGDNLYVYPNGSRKCRRCRTDGMSRSWRAARTSSVALTAVAAVPPVAEPPLGGGAAVNATEEEK